MAILSPFGVVCSSLQPIAKSHFTILFTSPFGSFQDSNNFEVLSFPRLSSEVAVESYKPFNSQIPIAGEKKSITGEMKFRFFQNSFGYQFWKNWFGAVYNRQSDRVGILPNYVGNGRISIYAPNGDPSRGMVEWGHISIYDCWPSALSLDDLTMSSDGEQWDFGVTLQILDAEFDYS